MGQKLEVLSVGQKQGDDLTRLEVLARMTDTEINLREIVDKFLLITYDIPHTPKGDRARREFLSSAKMIGASSFTDSVYLMPWTPEAERLALELTQAGKVCVWTAQTTDQARAEEITQSYDDNLAPRLDEIEGRIDRIDEHLNKKHFKLAKRMYDKTENMLIGCRDAVIRRGSAQLYINVTLLERRFNALLV